MSRLRERTQKNAYKKALEKKPELLESAEKDIVIFDLEAILVTVGVSVLLWILIHL